MDFTGERKLEHLRTYLSGLRMLGPLNISTVQSLSCPHRPFTYGVGESRKCSSHRPHYKKLNLSYLVMITV